MSPRPSLQHSRGTQHTRIAAAVQHVYEWGLHVGEHLRTTRSYTDKLACRCHATRSLSPRGFPGQPRCAPWGSPGAARPTHDERRLRPRVPRPTPECPSWTFLEALPLLVGRPTPLPPRLPRRGRGCVLRQQQRRGRGRAVVEVPRSVVGRDGAGRSAGRYAAILSRAAGGLQQPELVPPPLPPPDMPTKAPPLMLSEAPRANAPPPILSEAPLARSQRSSSEADESRPGDLGSARLGPRRRRRRAGRRHAGRRELRELAALQLRRRGAAPGRPDRGGGRGALRRRPMFPRLRLRSPTRSWPRFAATTRVERPADRPRPRRFRGIPASAAGRKGMRTDANQERQKSEPQRGPTGMAAGQGWDAASASTGDA